MPPLLGAATVVRALAALRGRAALALRGRAGLALRGRAGLHGRAGGRRTARRPR